MAAVVLLKEVVNALEMQFDEQAHYLDRKTGRVALVTTRLLGLAEESDEEPEDLLEWQEDEWELAQLIAASSDRFLELPTTFDVHEWQIMHDFAHSVEQEALRSELLSAIQGGGPFRMFKDVLRRHSKLDEWYEFRTEALAEIAAAWLKEHNIPYSDAPNPERRR